MGLLISIITFAALSLPAIYFAWSYPRKAKIEAAWKALFLWLVSTSPVIGGILLSSPKNNSAPTGSQFQIEVLASFTINEMFVYTAAFLAPVLYVVFDVVKRLADGDLAFRPKDLKDHLRGMQGVFLSAIVILIVTLLAYASAKSDPAGFPKTYLALFLTGKGFIVYLVSLLIWYSVILWETTPKNQFERQQKEENNQFSESYAKRRKGS